MPNSFRSLLRECAFPGALAIALIVVGTFPYVYGYVQAPPGMRYMGFAGRGALHSNGYMMFARQAQDGYHLFENRLTPEPLPRTYFHPEWWLFGKTARWTGLSLIGVFHIHRAITVILLVFGVHALVTLCLDSVFQRRLALMLIICGSGFGWIQWLASKIYVAAFPLLVNVGFAAEGARPVGFGVPRDVNGVCVFGYLINKPHFMLAGASIALTYAFLLAGERSGKRRYFLLSGLCALANAMIRAFAIPEIYLVYALYPVLLSLRERRLSWQRFANYAMAGAVLFPAVVHYAYLTLSNTLGISGWEIKAGTFIQYFMWYGLPMPLLLFFIFKGAGHLRELKPSTLLMTLWLTMAFLIAQLYPYVRFGEESAFYAFTTASVVLVVGGPLRDFYYAFLDSAVGKRLFPARMSPKRFKHSAAVCLVLFCSLSSGLVYARMFTALDRDLRDYYLEDDLYEAIEWLEANTAPKDVVLASQHTCAFVPRIARNKVFIGHDLLTNQRRKKSAIIRRFLGSRGDDAYKKGVVSEYGVKYVVFGPREEQANGMRPEDHSWLKPAFSCGAVSVYRVKF